MRLKNLALLFYSGDHKNQRYAFRALCNESKKEIEGVQDVQKVNVSLENRQDVVEFGEGKTDTKIIKAALKGSGYEPPLKQAFDFSNFYFFTLSGLMRGQLFPAYPA